MRMPLRMILVLLVLAVIACSMPGGLPLPQVGESTAALPPPPATPTSRPINLDHKPLYWFAPLPPAGPYGGTDGSKDFMDLFTPDAPWPQVSNSLHVFKLYGGWAASDASLIDLKQSIRSIRQRGLALAVELGPLNPTADCGLYVEGFAGEQGIQTVERIKRNGGDLQFIALDEPYYWAHFFDGDQACKWTGEKIARDVDSFIRLARNVFPDVIVGDIEPVTGPADAAAYIQWLQLFRRVNGYDLAFLHLDMDWSNTTWPQEATAIEDFGRANGIPVGMIYIGNFQDATDQAWISIAGERIKRYELEAGANPDHIIFQSWNPRPDRVLPETDPFTFTGLLRTYFQDKSALGFRPGSNPNLALKKPVQVSAAMPGADGGLAVDGDPGTVWNAGADAVQWIQIDLGQPTSIGLFRLVISQHPEGATVHQIWAGADPGNLSMLHEFSGFTRESDVLEFTAIAPQNGIRYVKILTLKSPSWVAWREIEILAP